MQNNTKGARVRLCGVWKRKTLEGNRIFYAGTISPTCQILIFPNSYRRSDTDPDAIVYVAANAARQQARPAREESADLDEPAETVEKERVDQGDP